MQDKLMTVTEDELEMLVAVGEIPLEFAERAAELRDGEGRQVVAADGVNVETMAVLVGDVEIRLLERQIETLAAAYLAKRVNRRLVSA